MIFFRTAQTILARAIPSLRFFSALYVPKTPSSIHYMLRDYDGDDFAWWRVVAHGSNAASRLLEPIPMETGDRIHRYLLSDEFEQTMSLDGEQQHCLNGTSGMAHVLGTCAQMGSFCPLLGAYEALGLLTYLRTVVGCWPTREAEGREGSAE